MLSCAFTNLFKRSYVRQSQCAWEYRRIHPYYGARHLEPGQQRLFPSLFRSLFRLPRHVQINVTSHRPALQTKLDTLHGLAPHIVKTFVLAVGNSELKYSIISMCFLMDWNNSTTSISYSQQNR
jgi:hypothetical protein